MAPGEKVLGSIAKRFDATRRPSASFTSSGWPRNRNGKSFPPTADGFGRGELRHFAQTQLWRPPWQGHIEAGRVTKQRVFAIRPKARNSTRVT